MVPPQSTVAAQAANAARTPADLLAAIQHLTASLEHLLGEPGCGAEESRAEARRELQLVREALGAPHEAGDAQLSPEGRGAKDAQRADPLHSPHVGG